MACVIGNVPSHPRKQRNVAEKLIVPSFQKVSGFLDAAKTCAVRTTRQRSAGLVRSAVAVDAAKLCAEAGTAGCIAEEGIAGTVERARLAFGLCARVVGLHAPLREID